MIVRIQFDAANAAFEHDAWGECVALIQKAEEKVAPAVAVGLPDSGSLMDSWGNTVGSWAVEGDE